MRDWVTTVKMQTNGPPDEGSIAALLDALEEFHVGGIAVHDLGLCMTCTVTTTDPAKAATAVTKKITAVSRRHHDLGTVIEVSALPADDRDAVLDGGWPEVVGIAECGQILGKSKQTASRLARDRRFPAPIAFLSSGPVWATTDVIRYAAQTS